MNMSFQTATHWRNVLDLLLFLCSLYLVVGITSRVFFRRRTTRLRGPPPDSWLFGTSKRVVQAEDTAVLHEEWAKEYGPVYRLPLPLGAGRIVLCDPKGVAHFYSRETLSYRMDSFSKMFVERIFGRGLLWAEGDSHKRQRKALTPAFSTQAIRGLTTVFYDSAHKLKAAWDLEIDSSGGETLLDVQGWMNKVSLDSIGIAGFSHDFGTLHGQKSKVAETFDSFTKLNRTGSSFSSRLIFLLAPVMPWLIKIPTKRLRIVDELNQAMGKVADDLLNRTRQEKDAIVLDGKSAKSLIETLLLSEDAQGQLAITKDEVFAQMKTLILAGYETTSISLTWALINLALKPEIQTTLRGELATLRSDITYDQLNSGFPYLDGVMKETLRLHPAVGGTNREAYRDDIIPLSKPVATASGKVVDRIFVASGTRVFVPIKYMNRADTLWGPDAKEFKPSRWLSEAGIPDTAKEIQGYSNILTFVDGPRTCLGRQFAITEFKAILSTLIRNYEFRLPNGTNTKFEQTMGILPRPRVQGEQGSRVPMIIKKVDWFPVQDDMMSFILT